MDIKQRETIAELGFKAGVPADLVVEDLSAWPWIVWANNTLYKFHPDKHVEVLNQMRHDNLKAGDTISITATVTPEKKVVFDCQIVARYSPPEGSEAYVHWQYNSLSDHQLRCFNTTILNAKKAVEANGLNFEITSELLPAIMSAATGLAIESHKRFSCTAFHSDPMDMPF
jgi:hypothetical protein